MKIKHFIDIENLRDESIDLGTIVRERNDQAFKKGDLITITEKIDGSNASVRYDAETKSLVAFSRKQELTFNNTLDGFYDYAKTLNPEKFALYPDYAFFGEWLRKNKISYNKDAMHIWYVYSIYDTNKEIWLTPNQVKDIAGSLGLTLVHELYSGPFVSWDHCRSFMNSPFYGDTQEGIVIRNISALEREERYPHIIKIVNDSFKETMKHHIKVVDPEKEKERADAEGLMKGIVTRSRVEKMLLKLRDEGIIPETITPKEMGLIAKELPKRIYEDCLKEEPEVMVACKEYAGKICSSITMTFAREIVLGG